MQFTNILVRTHYSSIYVFAAMLLDDPMDSSSCYFTRFRTYCEEILASVMYLCGERREIQVALLTKFLLQY